LNPNEEKKEVKTMNENEERVKTMARNLVWEGLYKCRDPDRILRGDKDAGVGFQVVTPDGIFHLIVDKYIPYTTTEGEEE
tara:strand:+ start:207 stop:446 length:240 start_codon:yes stop_codon:yes gene_type:complete